MRTALAVRHVHFEDLGTFEPLLRARGYAVEYLDAALEPVTTERALAPDLLIVLGGPIAANDVSGYPFLDAELSAVGARVRAGGPTLGICLGAQLIAQAQGARVWAMDDKEIGFGPIELTASGVDSVLAPLDGHPVLHWHGDTFDLPEGAIGLARTPRASAQAFTLGAHVLGLQFHPEVDASRIEEWLVGHAAELGGAGIDPRAIRADAHRYGEGLRAAATEMLTAWIDRVDAAR